MEMARNMGRRVVLIGLDGATFDIIRPLVNNGKLPNLKKIIANGASRILKSCIPPNTDPAWPVCFTGMNPGNLGFFFYMQDIGDDYYRKRLWRGPIEEDLFTEASKNGKRVVALNIPVSFPPKNVNGIYVTGLLTPENSEFTFPKSIKEELGEDYRISIPGFKFLTDDEKVENLKKEINRKFGLALEFYKKHKPELFTFVTMETDLVHHFFWRFMDEKHPLYEESKYKNVIADVYGLIDEKIGEFLKVIDDGLLLIISDHGAKGSYLDFNINRYLINHGFMKLKIAGKKKAFKFAYKILGMKNERVRGVAKKVFIGKNTRKISQNIQLGFRDIDWEESVAFGLGSYGLFINLQGREEHGLVSGEAYEKVREELIKELKGIEHDGKRVVHSVYKKEEIYNGKYMDKLPDIIFIAEPDFFVRDFFTEDEFTDSDFCSAHYSDGILIAYGKDVEKSRLEAANLIDIMPTILHALDCRIPGYCEGRVLKDMFKKSSDVYKQTPKFLSKVEQKTEDEKKRINEVLKGIKI